MNFVETGIEGLLIVEPKVYGDARGFFMETYNEQRFSERGLPISFSQDNFSRSAYGILRGLHFQTGESVQAKYVRVTLGKVFDVAVDLRKGSKTFGAHFGLELSDENKRALYIPEGFAHGFCVLSEVADFQYKCTKLYNPKAESGVIWNDSDLKIHWPIQDVKISEKDAKLPSFQEFKNTLKFL
jgi:dTDP-4-dehydrorhamnose 3,5-epimerase